MTPARPQLRIPNVTSKAAAGNNFAQKAQQDACSYQKSADKSLNY
jgi:hypothetical protein